MPDFKMVPEKDAPDPEDVNLQFRQNIYDNFLKQLNDNPGNVGMMVLTRADKDTDMRKAKMRLKAAGRRIKRGVIAWNTDDRTVYFKLEK